MDTATLYARHMDAFLHTITTAPVVTGPWADCTIPYQRETEDGSGCVWLVNYKHRVDDDCVQVEVTGLEFATDGPSFQVPLNAVAAKFLMSLEADIADELEQDR
jgi:hypothetical protein